jgi:hypothetical protein
MVSCIEMIIRTFDVCLKLENAVLLLMVQPKYFSPSRGRARGIIGRLMQGQGRLELGARYMANGVLECHTRRRVRISKNLTCGAGCSSR